MNNALAFDYTAGARFLPAKLNLRVFAVLIFISIISLLVFYIFQINNIIFNGYQIKDFQKRLDIMAKENRILEINYSQTRALENIEMKVQELGFEKVGKINYFQVLENSMAIK